MPSWCDAGGVILSHRGSRGARLHLSLPRLGSAVRDTLPTGQLGRVFLLFLFVHLGSESPPLPPRVSGDRHSSSKTLELVCSPQRPVLPGKHRRGTCQALLGHGEQTTSVTTIPGILSETVAQFCFPGCGT